MFSMFNFSMIHNPQSEERGGGLAGEGHAASKRPYQDVHDLSFAKVPHTSSTPIYNNKSPIKSFFMPKFSAVRQFYEYIMSSTSSPPSSSSGSSPSRSQ
jgi:hypothetical protein